MKEHYITKVINGQPQKLIPIELIRSIDENEVTDSKPYEYDNIQLVVEDYTLGYDLIICWNEGNDCRGCYLGYWNDGIVKPYK